jgi:hypothetical protein
MKRKKIARKILGNASKNFEIFRLLKAQSKEKLFALCEDFFSFSSISQAILEQLNHSLESGKSQEKLSL